MGSEEVGGLSEDRAYFDKQIVYYAEYQVVICIACGAGIAPGLGIKRHFKDYHKDWPLKLRKDIVKHISQLSLARPEDVRLPAPKNAPIFGLTLHDGWRCRDCQYCSPSASTMLEHCKHEHKWTKVKGTTWKPAKVQTFFVGRRRHFFEVARGTLAKSEVRTDIEDAVKNLLEEGERRDREDSKEATKLGDDQLPIDNTPWMRKTRWAKKFAGRDLLAVVALSRKPSKDEGSLMSVWDSVHRVLERCRVSITDWRNQEEDGDVVLGWLNTSQIDKFNPDPFSVYYDKSTHTKYTNWWAQGICYCLRLLHVEDRHGHSFTDQEEEALRKVWDIVELGIGDNAALDSCVFDLSVLFWTHSSRAHSRSAIIHFSAVFGIDNYKGCYRLPPAYGQILAALVYCARLLLFEYALPSADREHIDDPCHKFLEVHHQWLIDGRPTPFHYLNNLLAYALGAGKDVGGKPRVQWSGDRHTLFYQGQRLPLSHLRQFIDDLFEVAEQLLYHDLMFLPNSTSALKMNFKDIADDMNEMAIGYSFVTDPRNQLGGGRERMMKRLAASPKASSLLRVREGKLEAHPEEWHKYRGQLRQLQALIFLLTHTNSVTARGVEILPIRHVNVPQNPRNIFMYDGQIMIVTAYHKSQSMTGQHKVIARFLSSRLSRMYFALLTEVLPFATLCDRDYIPKSARSFLWADNKGIWNTSKATKILTEETSTRLGIRITIQDYRHISKAIDREHVRGLAAELDDNGDGDDIHDLAAGHAPGTADGVYGIDASMLRSLTNRTLQSFRAVSDRWHRFWGLKDKHQNKINLHIRNVSETAELPQPKRRLIHFQQEPEDDLESGLKKLIGPNATFRNAKQKEALIAVLKGISPLVVVLPPAGGKSLAFQLPASFPGGGTTVVILPYRALAQDLVKRCRALGLSSHYWTSQRQCTAQIVFVSAETAAVNDDFLTFVSELRIQSRLDRIVVDECHVPLSSVSYRHQLVHLDRLRSIPCQLVLLTGTMPPLLQGSLEDAFLLGSAEQGLQYIRASTNRPNVEYRVEVRGEAFVGKRVCELMERARIELPAGRRAIVFCRSRAVCEQTAEKLGCQLYHRTLEGKEELLAMWIDGSEKVMIATSALGTGVDIAGIEVVVHFSRPHGIIDYVQEVGRAGRKGEAVRSTIVLGEGEKKWMQSEAAKESDWNREALRLFVNETRCRRSKLGEIMDGEETQCGAGGGRACDLCSGVDGTGTRVESPQKATSLAEEQEKRYAAGPRLWQERVRQRAKERQTIEWAMAEIGSQCAACWLQGRSDILHGYENCPTLELAVGGGYWSKRRTIRFDKNSYCCYHCSLPGDWCPWYSEGKKCKQADIITPMVLSAWGVEEQRQRLEEEMGGAGVEKLMRWMGQASRVGGSKAANSVRVAEELIRQSPKSRA